MNSDWTQSATGSFLHDLYDFIASNIRFKTLHGGVLISIRFAVTPSVYLNYC